MDGLLSSLMEIGLTEKESGVYLTLVELGTAPASVVARRTKMTRTMAQYTCQQLQRKGLLRMVQRDRTYLFSAEPPETLITLLHEKREQLEEQEAGINRVMSELKRLQNPLSVLPKVRIFEGREGIGAAYKALQEAVKEGEEILSYLNATELSEDSRGMPIAISNFIKDRVQKRAPIRIIAFDNQWSRAYPTDPRVYRETKFLPALEDAHTASDVYIVGDHYYSFTIEPTAFFAVAIENANFVALQKALYESMWQSIHAASRSKSK